MAGSDDAVRELQTPCPARTVAVNPGAVADAERGLNDVVQVPVPNFGLCPVIGPGTDGPGAVKALRPMLLRHSADAAIVGWGVVPTHKELWVGHHLVMDYGIVGHSICYTVLQDLDIERQCLRRCW